MRPMANPRRRTAKDAENLRNRVDVIGELDA
jgi:hypothetical protein